MAMRYRKQDYWFVGVGLITLPFIAAVFVIRIVCDALVIGWHRGGDFIDWMNT